MRCILYDSQPMLVRDLQQPVHVSGLPAEVDGFDGPGPGGNQVLDAVRIDIVGVWLYICENRDGIYLQNGGGAGDIGRADIEYIVPLWRFSPIGR